MSSHIVNLLAARHTGDVFVSECKTGGSWTRHCPRLDAWAMKKSWEHPMTWGYEVKTSRSDFQRDDKWHDYLPYCNQLYFVCPYNLIQPEEVPNPAGLLWVSKNGTAIQPAPKKKAEVRNVVVPESLFRYILMHRAAITEARVLREETSDQRLEYWRQWLEKKRGSLDIGRSCSKALAEVRHEAREAMEAAKRQVDEYKTIQARIEELGFDPQKPVNQWDVSSKLRQLAGVIPQGINSTLERGIGQLKTLLELVEQLQKGDGV